MHPNLSKSSCPLPRHLSQREIHFIPHISSMPCTTLAPSLPQKLNPTSSTNTRPRKTPSQTTTTTTQQTSYSTALNRVTPSATTAPFPSSITSTFSSRNKQKHAPSRTLNQAIIQTKPNQTKPKPIEFFLKHHENPNSSPMLEIRLANTPASRKPHATYLNPRAILPRPRPP